MQRALPRHLAAARPRAPPRPLRELSAVTTRDPSGAPQPARLGPDCPPSVFFGEARELRTEHFLAMQDYAPLRGPLQALRTRMKNSRRVEIGPYASLTFLNYDLMWMQAHEMQYVLRAGPDQIQADIRAYGPLVPDGRSLSAMLMFGIEDARRRRAALQRLLGVERAFVLRVGPEAVRGEPVDDRGTPLRGVARTAQTSAMHFLRFPLNEAQAGALREAAGAGAGAGRAGTVQVACEHEAYLHSAGLAPALLAQLASDLLPPAPPS
eukprot:tig00001065_g6745.t1